MPVPGFQSWFLPLLNRLADRKSHDLSEVYLELADDLGLAASDRADALAYVKQIEKRIVLVDGQQLAMYMIQHNVGVTVEATYEVKKMDLDYFGES
jgi:restriction endonuclease Mrr